MPRARSFQRSSEGIIRSAVAAALALSLTACSLSPISRRSALFATAATATTRGTADAYQLVEKTYREAQVAQLVTNYDKDGFNTDQLQPFLSPKDQKVRTDILLGLRSYAELLAAVTSDQPLEAVDTGAKAVGASLRGLSANDLLQARFTTADANLAATALDALGRALVENKRRRELPGILRAMQQPIETICSLLEQDIGDPAHSGLRNQLHNNYLNLLRAQKNYISDNGPVLSPAEKRTEIRVLPHLAASEQTADRALAATQAALSELALTHTALAATAGQKDAPSFHLQMEQLSATVAQLHSFYTALPTE